MSIEHNKNIARQIFADLNDRNLDGVVSQYTTDSRFHGWAPETLDCAGYKAAMTAILDAFPDSQFPIEDIIADGNKVVVRHSLRGTHLAPFQDIAATGMKVVVNAIVILRIEDDKAAELWLNADFLGLMQQLGVIPAPQIA